MFKVMKFDMYMSLYDGLRLEYPSHRYPPSLRADLIMPFPRTTAIILIHKYQFENIWKTAPCSIKSLNKLFTYKRKYTEHLLSFINFIYVYLPIILRLQVGLHYQVLFFFWNFSACDNSVLCMCNKLFSLSFTYEVFLLSVLFPIVEEFLLLDSQKTLDGVQVKRLRLPFYSTITL